MHEPAAKVENEQPVNRSWRYFPKFRTLLLAAAIIWGVNRVPYEIGYWLLASAQNMAAAGDLPAAETRANYAATWLNGSDLPYDVQSQIQLQANQVDAALASLSQAIKLSPNNIDFKLRQAWILLDAQRTSELEQEIDRVSKLEDRQEYNYRLLFAWSISLYGNHPLALKVINQVPYTKKEAADVCRIKSNILMQTGQYQEALAACEVAVDMTGETSALIQQRIDLLLHLQRNEDALALMQRVEKLQLDTISERVMDVFWKSSEDLNRSAYNRGVANLELDLAEKLAELAVQKTKSKAYQVLDTRGYVKYRLGKFDEALTDLNRAVKMMEAELADPIPGSRHALAYKPPYEIANDRWTLKQVRSVVYYHRAIIHQAMKNQPAAEEDFARIKALGIEPSEHLF